MAMHLLKEGIRMLRRSLEVRRVGYQRYDGDAEMICKEIVKRCWNGTYLQVSTGHFSEFYMRDIGICAEALMTLGYERELYKTLQYCLNRYSGENKLTTTITPDGTPIDIFHYAPDTLAFLLHTLRVCQADDLVKTYKPFLEQQAHLYKEEVLDSSGLVNVKRYSGMRDHASRRSSCYDNCMTAMISSELGRLCLENPLKGIDSQNLIKHNFWDGSHFSDDLSTSAISGDASVFPFWCGVFDDISMAKKAIASVRKEKLDQPFPLRYEAGKLKRRSSPWTLLAPNYEGSTVWLHLGLCYLDVVARYDSELCRSYLRQYAELLEKHGNLIEVFNSDETPYSSLFYAADDSLIWAAKFLNLKKKVGI
jgi:hypothetical protein